MSFTDPDEGTDVSNSTSVLEEHKNCYACALQYLEEFRSNCVKSSTNLTIFGREYHCHDFVYVRQENERDILCVAQIVDLLPHNGNDELSVHFFSRYEDVDEDEDWVRTNNPIERVSVSHDFHAAILLWRCESESVTTDE